MPPPEVNAALSSCGAGGGSKDGMLCHDCKGQNHTGAAAAAATVREGHRGRLLMDDDSPAAVMVSGEWEKGAGIGGLGEGRAGLQGLGRDGTGRKGRQRRQGDIKGQGCLLDEGGGGAGIGGEVREGGNVSEGERNGRIS